MLQDAGQIKEKIISFIKINGPSLPVQIAKPTGLNILFASAFLSELFGDKKIKMSYLRVGSSPLYFLDEQEFQLENFFQYLKSKNKEAFLLLKEKRILKDSDQHPAIRVALREIKDYAISFHKDEELYWRYFLFSEQQVSEYFSDSEKLSLPNQNITELNPPEKKEETLEKESKEKLIGDIEGSLKYETKKSIKKEKAIKKTINKKSSKSEKKNENFFNQIKEFLSKKNIEILDIKDFKNDEAILRVKNKGIEEIIFFYNRKKITEKEIISSFKKISNENLKYSIFFFGEPSKKLEQLISSIQNLSSLTKVE